MLGFAGELRAQLRILRRDAHGAGIEVALPHHHAPRRDERRGGEPEFVGAEQGTDDDVATGLQLAVHLEPHGGAQTVEQQRLLRLGESHLPWHAGVLDGRQR